jgi:polyphosphate kinase
VDEAIIDALYRASNAGVPIDIVVRGICSLRAGVPGLSENIRVRSVLGRYLEHSRVFSFHNNGDPQVFIGSSDMMHRNLDRRVEALVRIVESEHIEELDYMFDVTVDENTASWWLDSEGDWVRHGHSADGEPLNDLQNVLMKRISQRKRGGVRR